MIIHKTIYLQDFPDEYTTWCQDKINDDDIEYRLADEWVSVEDELPHEPGYYLIFDKNSPERFKRHDIIYFRGKRWASPMSITHWTTLPSDPK